MRGFIKKFTDKEIIDFNNVVKINNEFYLVDKSLKQIQNKATKQPSYIGIYLGKSEKPSLYLLQKLINPAKKKIWVNEKGEWLVICKRDVFGKSITKIAGDPKKNDFVLILNQYEECIGYGQVIDLASKKTAVKRIFDIGDFLRRERKN